MSEKRSVDFSDTTAVGYCRPMMNISLLTFSQCGSLFRYNLPVLYGIFCVYKIPLYVQIDGMKVVRLNFIDRSYILQSVCEYLANGKFDNLTDTLGHIYTHVRRLQEILKQIFSPRCRFHSYKIFLGLKKETNTIKISYIYHLYVVRKVGHIK